VVAKLLVLHLQNVHDAGELPDCLPQLRVLAAKLMHGLA